MLPKRIKIGKFHYDVRVGKNDRAEFGRVEYVPGIIYVHKNIGRRPISKHQQHETYWHEVTHAVLYEMGNPLHRNEKFVKRFAELLSQSINSAEF